MLQVAPGVQVGEQAGLKVDEDLREAGSAGTRGARRVVMTPACPIGCDLRSRVPVGNQVVEKQRVIVRLPKGSCDWRATMGPL